jgi:tetratricopeptide (TPR) repeat protein
MKNFLLYLLMPVFAAALFSFSCTKEPNMETINLYVRASDAYASENFSQVMEILGREEIFPPSLVLRAKAEYFYGDLKKAEKSCRRALKLKSSSFEAKLFLARIMREKGNLENAVQLIESALADNPQDIRALRLAAELAKDAEKNDEALAYLDRAAEFSAESAMVLLDRARFRWIAGKDMEALEDLSRAKAMLPWDTPLLRSILNLEKIIMEVM